jgi:hypothetical protein
VSEKFVSNVLSFRRGRLAFAKIHKAEARRGRNGAPPRPDAKKTFSWEILLDPSNADHAKTIAEIRAEAARALTHRYGADKSKWPQNLIFPFGLGNDLPKQGKKVYDGYKDMFYIRMKRYEEDGRPLLGNRAGQVVQQGDPQCPYSGCYTNGKFTLWSYDNESRGVNSTGRSLQFVEDGPAFSGGGALDAEDEFEALGDAPTGSGAGANSGPDPFAIP